MSKYIPFERTAVQTTNEAIVNNSTTLANAADLSVPVLANRLYQVELHVWGLAAAAAGFKIGFSIPDGAFGTLQQADGGSTVNSTPGTITVTATGDDQYFKVVMKLEMGSNDGDLVVQAAQGTANASDLTFYKGSQLVVKNVLDNDV